MALDLSSAGVRLMHCPSGGAWQALGSAALDRDFTRTIESLRREALARSAGGPAIVELWLPPEQVLMRHHDLPEGSAGQAEATRRLSAETGCAPGALCVAVGTPAPGEPAMVLAVAIETVSEARDYATRWGFEPRRVTTRLDVDGGFGADGPSFELPRRGAGGAASTAGRGAAVAAVMAAVLGAGTLAGLGLWGDGTATLAGTTASIGPAPVLARIEAGPPSVPHVTFTQVHRVSMPALSAGTAGSDRAAGASVPAAPIVTAGPGVLAQPSDGVAMQVGPGPLLPRHLRPGRLERPADGPGQTGLAAALHGTQPLAREETAPTSSAAQAATELATGTGGVEQNAVPVTIASAAARDEATAQPAVMHVASDRPAGAEARHGATGESILLAAATMAPKSIPAPPLPRPEPASDGRAADGGAAEAEAATAPEAGSDSGAKPDPTPADAPQAADASTSDYAAREAPRPPARPEQVAARLASTDAVRAFGGKLSPANVGKAAAKHGLTLDSTMLIGVLEARAGREALLRTSGGQFVKAGRGDSVEGWRITAVNRDSVRLSRGGQNRTLLLVAR